MKGSRRIFKSAAIQHIYQNTYNGGVIFYRLEDYLLFYTIFSTMAKRIGVKVISLCMMINHLHSLVDCKTKSQLSKFVKLYTSIFVKEYNRNKSRKGSLFRSNFGSASKVGPKFIMNAISYLGNNPVLKRLCNRAEEYRWSFLAYYRNPHPFSSRLVIRKSSTALRKSIDLVKILVKHNKYLNYTLQTILFKNLTEEEKAQLTDYIISSYSVIDYEEAIKFYGSYDKMLLAINSNSGSEYDMKEDWESDSDMEFSKMISVTEKTIYGGPYGFNFQHIEDKELIFLIRLFRKKLHITKWHIRKFFHIEVEKAYSLMKMAW